MRTARTRRVSATERFKAEASRKRPAPVAVILGVIGAGLLVAVGMILFGGDGGPNVALERAEIHERRAAELEDRGDLDGAVRELRAALGELRDYDALASRKAGLRARIAGLRERKALRAANAAVFAKFEARASAADTREKARALLEEGRRLRLERPALAGRLDPLLTGLEKRAAGPRIPGFHETRRDLSKRFDLADGGKARFAEAVAAWRAYLDTHGEAVSRGRVEEEIRRLTDRAAEERSRLERRLAAGTLDAAAYEIELKRVMIK